MTCKQSFSASSILKQHERIHVKVLLPYSCKICKKSFSKKVLLFLTGKKYWWQKYCNIANIDIYEKLLHIISAAVSLVKWQVFKYFRSIKVRSFATDMKAESRGTQTLHDISWKLRLTFTHNGERLKTPNTERVQFKRFFTSKIQLEIQIRIQFFNCKKTRGS